MFVAAFECSDARNVVNGGILETANVIAGVADEGQELTCCGVWFGLKHARSARRSANAIATRNACDKSIRDFDVVTTLTAF